MEAFRFTLKLAHKQQISSMVQGFSRSEIAMEIWDLDQRWVSTSDCLTLTWQQNKFSFTIFFKCNDRLIFIKKRETIQNKHLFLNMIDRCINEKHKITAIKNLNSASSFLLVDGKTEYIYWLIHPLYLLYHWI